MACRAHWRIGDILASWLVNGQLVGAVLGAAAAVLAAALVVKGRGQPNSAEDVAEADGNETGETEGELADA